MKEQSNWTPDRDAAIKSLIRQTIKAAGPIAPDKLPHHIKTVLQQQIGADGMSANKAIDSYIAEIMREEGGH